MSDKYRDGLLQVATETLALASKFVTMTDKDGESTFQTAEYRAILDDLRTAIETEQGR
ncbi:hypothetical protein [Amycolatopsis sp.]|jgi:hypothetical protein|uniref:hypothetical protein n=1 Tax=Amycolatopsis sp. TaxID=37632 RepID=UPI002E01060E|nr:hypothetical protein [Amycolatopsis sp.]